MIGIVPVVQRYCLSASFLPESVKTFLAHPAGPFTVFFWAPTCKWAITFTNIGEFSKPAETISAKQQIAILTTAAIWCKYALAVIPVNYNMMIVNVFMGMTANY